MDQAKEVTNKFDGEDVGQVKMTKVEKFFHSQREKFNKNFEGETASLFNKFNIFSESSNAKLDNFVVAANATIKKSDDKFSGLYNFLVKQFLTNLEDRVYTLELSNKATIQLLTEKLHKLEQSAVTQEEYAVELQAIFLKNMTSIHQASSEAAAKGQANVEPIAEVVEESVQETAAEPTSEETAVQ